MADGYVLQDVSHDGSINTILEHFYMGFHTGTVLASAPVPRGGSYFLPVDAVAMVSRESAVPVD